MTTCKRPKCERAAIHNARGYCRKHAYAQGVFTEHVPTDRVREHIKKLADQGASVRAIGLTAGLSHFAAGEILTGKVKKVHPNTVKAICGLTIDDVESGYVPAWRAARRLRALRAAGWRTAELVKATGVSRAAITRICANRTEKIMRTIDMQIRDAYTDLGEESVGPADPQVANHRWPLPLEWDDIDNDLNPQPFRFKGEWMVTGTPEHRQAARALLTTRPANEWVAEGWPAGWLNKIAGDGPLPRIGIELADRLIATDRNIKTSTRKKDAA